MCRLRPILGRTSPGIGWFSASLSCPQSRTLPSVSIVRPRCSFVTISRGIPTILYGLGGVIRRSTCLTWRLYSHFLFHVVPEKHSRENDEMMQGCTPSMSLPLQKASRSNEQISQETVRAHVPDCLLRKVMDLFGSPHDRRRRWVTEEMDTPSFTRESDQDVDDEVRTYREWAASRTGSPAEEREASLDQLPLSVRCWASLLAKWIDTRRYALYYRFDPNSQSELTPPRINPGGF
jgi:hypothetical protein